MFRIGDFSKVAQLSIRMLRHYDEIGLLRPAHIDPANGYRYYTAEQLADVNRLVALKDLGLGLEQIRLLLREDVSAAEIVGMLRLESARAEQARALAERRLGDLEQRLAELADLGSLSGVDIVVKSVPATPFLSHRATLADLGAVYALMDRILAAGKRRGIHAPLVALGHDAFFDTEHLDVELGYPVSRSEPVELDDGRRMTVGQLPAVAHMLSLVQRGSPEDGHRRCHNAVGLWLERHRYQLAGPNREILHDPGGGDTPPTIEIQFPVTPDSPATPDSPVTPDSG